MTRARKRRDPVLSTEKKAEGAGREWKPNRILRGSFRLRSKERLDQVESVVASRRKKRGKCLTSQLTGRTAV